MVDLATPDVARRKGQVPTEEEGDGQVAVTDDSHRDRLSPPNVGRGHSNLNMCWIQAGGVQFHPDPVPNYGIILASLAGDSRPDCGGRLLADPDMNQAAELDNAEENRQQYERDSQYRLERFLSALLSVSAGSCHDVWVSRCTIWPILATRPLFQAMIPTTRVPRMMAAPITHSRVDCPRSKVFTFFLRFPSQLPLSVAHRLIQTRAA